MRDETYGISHASVVYVSSVSSYGVAVHRSDRLSLRRYLFCPRGACTLKNGNLQIPSSDIHFIQIDKCVANILNVKCEIVRTMYRNEVICNSPFPRVYDTDTNSIYLQYLRVRRYFSLCLLLFTDPPCECQTAGQINANLGFSAGVESFSSFCWAAFNSRNYSFLKGALGCVRITSHIQWE